MASEKSKRPAAAVPPTSREFRVVSGVHRDAVFALEDTLLVIGADESCDIRLSDSGMAPRHAALTCQGLAVAIRPLDGALAIDGQGIAAASRALLAPGAMITLGESGVTLQLADCTAAQYPARPAGPAARRGGRWSKPFTLVLLSMVLVAGAGIAAQKLKSARAAPVPAQRSDLPSLQSTLQKLHLDKTVAVTATPYGVELSGVLEREAAAKLRSALAALSTPIVDSILSDEDLVEQVREVFRTHGYRADLSYAGERRVLVANLDETHDRVRQAATHVRSDVPQLAALNFAAPDEAPPPEHVPPYEGAGANRITARIDDDTAYLAAAGGARYFVGSVLPDGHTVRRITPRAVQVERDGEISWRAF
jgi:type III secretion system YscD/HrpQ family protein